MHWGIGIKIPSRTVESPKVEPIPLYKTGKLLSFTRAQKNLKVTEHFTIGDFWTENGYSVLKIDPALFGIMEKVYKHFGIMPRLRNKYGPLSTRYAAHPVASYRPTGTTFHRHTTALDIYVPGIPAVVLARFLETLPEVGGVGLYTASLTEIKHVHVDVKRSPSTSPKARGGRTCWWLKTSGSKTPGHGGILTVFKLGHRSIAIKEIQMKLNELGFAGPSGRKLITDGDMGTNTVYALKAFQRANNLTTDGRYGPQVNAFLKLFAW